MSAADGRIALLTRAPDLRQARHTSNIADIRVWKDGEGVDPTRDLKAMLVDLGARGRLGVEFDSYGLTHFNGLRLQATLAGFAELVDASSLVASLRTTKSAEELVYVREAARLSDLADAPRSRRPEPGPTRARSLPRCTARSSLPAATIPATNSSSARAPTRCCAATRAGGASLSADDQLTLEFAGVSRHYHAAIMRTHVVGRPKPQHLAYQPRAREALAGVRGRIAARPHGRRSLRRPRARVRRPRSGSATGSTPAAIRSAPSSRRHGWTCRCSTGTTPSSSPPGRSISST